MEPEISSSVELLATRNGRPCLIVNGYQHRIHRKTDSIINWACVRQKKDKCKGKAKTNHHHELLSMANHSCEPNIAEIEVKKIMLKCRKRVREEISVPVHQIFHEEISGTFTQDCDLLIPLPLYENVKSSLCKERRKILGKKSLNLLHEANTSAEASHLSSPEMVKSLEVSNESSSISDIRLNNMPSCSPPLSKNFPSTLIKCEPSPTNNLSDKSSIQLNNSSQHSSFLSSASSHADSSSISLILPTHHSEDINDFLLSRVEQMLSEHASTIESDACTFLQFYKETLTLEAVSPSIQFDQYNIIKSIFDNYKSQHESLRKNIESNIMTALKNNMSQNH